VLPNTNHFSRADHKFGSKKIQPQKYNRNFPNTQDLLSSSKKFTLDFVAKFI